VQPAASAGATLQAIWFAGQFQGVISAHADGLAHDLGRALHLLELEVLQNPERDHEVTEPGRRLQRLRDGRDRGAHLLTDRLRHVVHAALVDLDDPAEQRHALLARGPRPGLERVLCRGDCPVHVGPAAQ
jgi:hypothetical protein